MDNCSGKNIFFLLTHIKKTLEVSYLDQAFETIYRRSVQIYAFPEKFSYEKSTQCFSLTSCLKRKISELPSPFHVLHTNVVKYSCICIPHTKNPRMESMVFISVERKA